VVVAVVAVVLGLGWSLASLPALVLCVAARRIDEDVAAGCKPVTGAARLSAPWPPPLDRR
jgi:hypothetical protein